MQIIVANLDHIPQIKEIFREYARSLDFDLSFQNFEQELAGLPGMYAEPDGCILLAYEKNEIVGCVALRKFSGDIAEMKRLFVRPLYQGRKFGRMLALEILQQARIKKYKKIRLDTISTMKSAEELYRSLGFKTIEAYRENPIDGASFYELDL